jgi:hypothetical protein
LQLSRLDNVGSSTSHKPVDICGCFRRSFHFVAYFSLYHPLLFGTSFYTPNYIPRVPSGCEQEHDNSIVLTMGSWRQWKNCSDRLTRMGSTQNCERYWNRGLPTHCQIIPKVRFPPVLTSPRKSVDVVQIRDCSELV